jgi:peptidoglycan/LPS O-acetylase OafA/YrhL
LARLPTLDDRLKAVDGHPSGFDALRVVLAIAVICVHSVRTSYGVAVDALVIWRSPLRGLTSIVLPMFFALSGFLVAGSLERTPALHQFLTLRVVRIAPALAVETLLSALILGPLLTSWSLHDYFSGHELRSYFLNIAGDVHYHLPGVFSEVPGGSVVNISLWTVPFELECYIIIGLLAAVSLTRRPNAFAVLVLGSCAALPLATFLLHWPQVYERPRGQVLVASFLCGVVLFQQRRRIPRNGWLAFASAVAAVGLLMSSKTHFWAAPFAAYTTVYIGTARAPRLPIFRTGDYSYGMYLFAFPMQQLYASLFPGARLWWLNVGFAVILSLVYAMFSWHVVEKRVLGNKARIVGAVDKTAHRLRSFVSDRLAGPSTRAGRSRHMEATTKKQRNLQDLARLFAENEASGRYRASTVASIKRETCGRLSAVRYYVLRGEEPVPATAAEHFAWRRSAGGRTYIAATEVGASWVLTEFVGVDVDRDEPRGRQLFHTAVCSRQEAFDGLLWRTRSYAEARDRHAGVVRALENGHAAMRNFIEEYPA